MSAVSFVILHRFSATRVGLSTSSSGVALAGCTLAAPQAASSLTYISVVFARSTSRARPSVLLARPSLRPVGRDASDVGRRSLRCRARRTRLGRTARDTPPCPVVSSEQSGDVQAVVGNNGRRATRRVAARVTATRRDEEGGDGRGGRRTMSGDATGAAMGDAVLVYLPSVWIGWRRRN